jgi:hypothetical protein
MHLVVSLLLLSLAAFAQGSGSLSGTVVDPSGATVAGAQVRVRQAQTGAQRSAPTDANGFFSLSSLPVGEYTLEVEAAGFQRFRQANIQLQIDERLRIDPALVIGAPSEVVEVRGQASAVNTTDAVLRNVIDNARMVQLPLNGRNALQLVALTPGVVPIRSDVGGSFQPADQVAVSVSGSKSNGINYLLDGGDNMDTYRSVANSFPNPDLIQEISIQTNSYSAEYGGRAGGVVNVATRAGSNQFHGSAFWFLRNYRLNAGNFFAPFNPVTGRRADDGLKRNQNGGTFGGPIIRNRTFFFGGFQNTNVRQRPNTLTARVLTEAQRRGDFSGLFTGQGNLIVIRDPASANQPFAGNAIPSSRLSPVFQKFLAQGLPAAQESSGLLRYGQRIANDNLEYSIRVDHNFTDRDRLFGRFFRETNNQPNPGIEGNLLSYSTRTEQRALNGGLTYSKVLSPSLLLELTSTVNRSFGLRGDVAPFTWLDLGVNIPSAGSSKDFILNGLSSYFAINLFGNTPLARTNYQNKAALAWTRGRHTLKFGADIIRRQFNIPIVNTNFHGSFSFSAALTGDNAADALLGLPSAFSQSDGFRVKLRQTDWVAFVQDDFRWSRRITVNLGLRWEPFRPWEDQFLDIPQSAYFVPGARSSVFTQAPTGLLFYGDPNVQRQLARQVNSRFSPRLGLAIDPFGDGRSAIRIGYGVFFDTVLPTEQQQQSASLPSFATSVGFAFPPSLQDPYAGRTPPFPGSFPKPANTPFPGQINWNAMALDFQTPYIQQWNATLERQLLGSSTVVRATYQGSKGTRLPLVYTANPAPYIPGQSTRANIEQRRLYEPGRLGPLKTLASFGHSTYHALVLSMDKRFSRNYTLNASYTWSANIDSGPNAATANATEVNNPFRFFSDRGRADGDRPHVLVASYLWDLPKLTNRHPLWRHTLGGWQNNAILSLYSGFPFNLTPGIDQAMAGGGNQRPDLAGNPFLPTNRSNGDKINAYFNTSAIRLNTEGTFGTLPRNVLRGPGTVNLDLGLFKQISLYERHILQFRAEFFNVTNRTTLGTPVTNLQDRNFGRILSAGGPRVIQFALRYSF